MNHVLTNRNTMLFSSFKFQCLNLLINIIIMPECCICYFGIASRILQTGDRTSRKIVRVDALNALDTIVNIVCRMATSASVAREVVVG